MNAELERLLAELMLYRDDPHYASRLRAHAEAGEVNAQYALGLVYAEGRGVAPDPVAAYYWLRRAEAQGDTDAQTLRYVVLQQMNVAQVDEAELALAQFERQTNRLQ